MSAEEWKSIPGHGENYIVSSHGRVARLMKCRITPNGYRYACLSDKWKASLHLVHRLVAEAFLGPSLKRLVHHRDNVKTHNHASNLQYATHKENTRKAFTDGLIGIREDHHSAKLTWEQVRDIRRLCLGKKRSQQSIAQEFCVSQTTISHIYLNKQWKES